MYYNKTRKLRLVYLYFKQKITDSKTDTSKTRRIEMQNNSPFCHQHHSTHKLISSLYEGE